MKLTKQTANFSDMTDEAAQKIIETTRSQPFWGIAPFTEFTSKVCTTRALLYAFMSGMNNHIINEIQFTAGCNRFGIENPTPTVRKRIALYGNSTDIAKLVKDVHKQAFGM